MPYVVTEEYEIHDGVITQRCTPEYGPAFDLHIVFEYKHLGAMTTVAGSADRDIAVRTAMMTSADVSFCNLYSDWAGTTMPPFGIAWKNAGPNIELMLRKHSKYRVSHGPSSVLHYKIDMFLIVGTWRSTCWK